MTLKQDQDFVTVDSRLFTALSPVLVKNRKLGQLLLELVSIYKFALV